MKKLLLLSSAFLFSVSIAQNKLLTIQEAVSKGRTTLAPKRLQGISFITGTDKFSYIDNNMLKIGDNVSGKTMDAASLKDLNINLKSSQKDTMAAIATVTWKNANQFYFSNKKGEWIYSLDKKYY